MANRTKLTAKKREALLALLANGDTVEHACRQIGIARTTATLHRNTDPAFAAAWAEALESGTQLLEQEAIRRAYYGTEKALTSMGRIVGTEQQYSDTLLIFLLKARRPEVYRDNVNIEVYIRKAALEAGIDPDAAVAEAQSIVKEAKAR